MTLTDQLAAALRLVRAEIAMDPKRFKPGTVECVNHAWAAYQESKA